MRQEPGLPAVSPLVGASTVSLGSGFVGERVDIAELENEIAFAKASRKKQQVTVCPNHTLSIIATNDCVQCSGTPPSNFD